MNYAMTLLGKQPLCALNQSMFFHPASSCLSPPVTHILVSLPWSHDFCEVQGVGGDFGAELHNHPLGQPCMNGTLQTPARPTGVYTQKQVSLCNQLLTQLWSIRQTSHQMRPVMKALKFCPCKGTTDENVLIAAILFHVVSFQRLFFKPCHLWTRSNHSDIVYILYAVGKLFFFLNKV